MSLDYFRLSRGIEFEDGSNIIQGSGAPGTSGDSTTVPVGSFYQRTDIGEVYVKIAPGSGTNKWQRLTTKEEVDALVNGISWREPVKVKDSTSYANLAAAETAMNTGFLDGVAVVNGNRVLLDNITGSNKNVYIVTGTPGSGATLVEDPYNTVTDGDALLVQLGSSADQQWVFNGTNWVLFADNSNNAELQYIRAFIGKDFAGSEMPNYSSNNFVVDGTSLETAVGVLDAEIGPNVTNGTAILSTNSVNANIQAIDNFLAQNGGVFSATNVTTITTVDSVSTSVAQVAKWLVEGKDNTNSKRNSVEVTACLNFAGTGIDFSRINILRPDSAISGFTVTVDVSGGNIRLRVSSSDAVDVTAKRLAAF